MNPKKAKSSKKRNWGFILYPDSAPENWVDILQQTGLPAAVSPLHDKDLNADGEPKKDHYNVIVCYSGLTSYNVVCCVTQNLNATIPLPLESVRGMYRYFTHIDNPEKYQYDSKDIRTLNGFDILDFVEMTKSEVNKALKDLKELIRNLDIMEYADFMDFLLDNAQNELYDVASSHTYFFEKYISSRRNKSNGRAT